MAKAKRRRKRRTLSNRLSGLWRKIVSLTVAPWRAVWFLWSSAADGELRAELREANYRIDDLQHDLEVKEHRIEMLIAWQDKEMARLEAESAIQAARKARALNIAMQGDDEDIGG